MIVLNIECQIQTCNTSLTVESANRFYFLSDMAGDHPILITVSDEYNPLL